MIEWLDDFYSDPDMRSTLLRNFLPVFTNYVTEATGGPVAASFVQALAENYVERHLGSSRAQLQEVVKGADDPLAALSQRFDEWEEKRPGKVAANELVRSANAANVQQMREAGVTKMVWRASGGKTCPFCTELDGVIISVEGTFFEEGDELNPEPGVTTPIRFESSLGHPPVHQGCVCSVEAVADDEQQALGFADDAQPTDAAADRLRAALPNAEVDLRGMHPEMAREVADALEQMAVAHPRVAAKFGGIRMTNDLPDNAYAEIVTDAGRIGEGGRWVPGSGRSVMTLNAEKFADPNALRESLKIGEVMGFNPPGANTVESIIVHEYGHVVSNEFSSIATNRKYMLAGRDVAPISEYGAKNASELFAENYRAIYYTPREQWTEQVRILDGLLSRQRGK